MFWSQFLSQPLEGWARLRRVAGWSSSNVFVVELVLVNHPNKRVIFIRGFALKETRSGMVGDSLFSWSPLRASNQRPEPSEVLLDLGPIRLARLPNAASFFYMSQEVVTADKEAGAPGFPIVSVILLSLVPRSRANTTTKFLVENERIV
jgi:hypothetical protein